MNWLTIKTRHAELVAASNEGADLSGPWDAFVEACLPTEASPPYHLGDLFRTLETVRSERSREEIAILDHGCGSAMAILYLAALGYRNVYGVDIETDYFGNLTPIFEHVFGTEEKRYHIYDGRILPFEDSTIDFVFSQQVLEHVEDSVLRTYYSEEARVLVAGGTALHGVPHRLVPYETHTKTWLLHWFLPRKVWASLLGAFGYDKEFLRDWLYLRWPWVHRRMMREYFGDCRDTTIERLRNLEVGDYYDGPRTMRSVMTKLVRIPVLGSIFGTVLANMVMLDTISVKKVSQS